MARKCTEIPLDSYKEEFRIKGFYNVSLFVDDEYKEEIINFLSKNRDRFLRALYEILQGRYNNDLYGKEKISEETYNITAIKFKRTRGSNYRIYCKEFIDEFSPNVKKVIMIRLYNKKSQKNNKKIKQLLNSIVNYDYDC